MNVSYPCPACHVSVRAEFTADSTEVVCPSCGFAILIPDDAVTDQRVNRCLVCPSTDLFARKDFPQRLGVTLVVLGFVASSIAWANYQVFWTFAILFITALVDLVLYIVMGESLTCYRCQAQYRGVDEIERHGGFELETHERYRQMAARVKEQAIVGASR
jgi:DNA-directed RNA polymerase subunit RPC12/RpoP